jgi:branched-chain amino acid transport system ATP-binding protein
MLHGEEAAMNPYILEAQGLRKDFGGFCAVSGVDLRVRRGHIHALIGPNGAGKSTTFNLLTKFLQPSGGSISYNGRDITRLRPAAVARLGLVRSFQISAVFPHLSVLDNVRIALQRKLGTAFHFWRNSNGLDVLNDRAEELLTSVGLGDCLESVAADLSYGKRRALEIATTLSLDPEMLLLDEPMAGLGREDIGVVSDLIRQVGERRTVLMVEHNLSVVAALSDTITVMARGQVLAEGAYSEVSKNLEVRAAYMGVAHV